MDEIFELVEGRFGDPNSDEDILGHCERFNRTERCVRVTAKDCLSGIHKAATSAVSLLYLMTFCYSEEKKSTPKLLINCD